MKNYFNLFLSNSGIRFKPESDRFEEEYVKDKEKSTVCYYETIRKCAKNYEIFRITDI